MFIIKDDKNFTVRLIFNKIYRCVCLRYTVQNITMLFSKYYNHFTFDKWMANNF